MVDLVAKKKKKVMEKIGGKKEVENYIKEIGDINECGLRRMILKLLMKSVRHHSSNLSLDPPRNLYLITRWQGLRGVC
jgi:hypothetical protein